MWQVQNMAWSCRAVKVVKLRASKGLWGTHTNIMMDCFVRRVRGVGEHSLSDGFLNQSWFLQQER